MVLPFPRSRVGLERYLDALKLGVKHIQGKYSDSLDNATNDDLVERYEVIVDILDNVREHIEEAIDVLSDWPDA